MQAKQRTELHLVDLQAQEEADIPAPQPPTPPKRRIWLRVFIWSFLLLLLAAVVALVVYEMRTSWLQSREFTRYAKTLTYELKPGPSKAIRFPEDGPFDKRLGYVLLPMMQQRLIDRGFEIRQQVQFSPALMEYRGHGLFPPYAEKTQAGISVITSYSIHYTKLYESFRAVGRGGVILLFAPAPAGTVVPLNINDVFWRRDVTVTTSYAASPSDCAEALELIRSKQVLVEDMITHRFGLAETGKA